MTHLEGDDPIRRRELQALIQNYTMAIDDPRIDTPRIRALRKDIADMKAVYTNGVAKRTISLIREHALRQINGEAIAYNAHVAKRLHEKHRINSAIMMGQGDGETVAKLYGWNKGGLRHGYTETQTYRSWASMIQRCQNPRYKLALSERYVTTEWSKGYPFAFDNFLKDMGEQPVGTQLRLREGSHLYTRNNCAWVPVNESLSCGRGFVSQRYWDKHIAPLRGTTERSESTTERSESSN
jgi:hypothetical protein